MEPRPKGFLSHANVDHDSEVFDYIKELHDYLWTIIRAVTPGSGGSLDGHLDDCVAKLTERSS